MGKLQPHGGAHHRGTVGSRGTVKRNSPFDLCPMKLIQDPDIRNCRSHRAGHRHKKRQRPGLRLHMLRQRQPLVRRQRSANHHTVEGCRPVQHLVQGRPPILPFRAAGNQQPSRSRGSGEVFDGLLIRFTVRSEAQSCHPGGCLRRGTVALQSPAVRESGILHQQKSCIKSCRRFRSPDGIDCNPSNCVNR